MNTFEWCGYNWRGDMFGRIIHSEHPYSWYSAEEIILKENNELEFYIKYDPKDVEYKGNVYHPKYKASVIRSVESFGYGTFSCEMRMPTGHDFTSSFWLSGNKNWPPEIDINEGFVNRCWLTINGWNTTTNVHYRDELMEHDHVRSKCIPVWKQIKNPANNFIRYEVEWLPDKITFKTNGKITRTIEGDVCYKLTHNLNNPEKGYLMNVIFNTWNHTGGNSVMKTPMVIRNFKHMPYDKD